MKVKVRKKTITNEDIAKALLESYEFAKNFVGFVDHCCYPKEYAQPQKHGCRKVQVRKKEPSSFTKA